MTALQGTAAGVPAAASQEDDRGASWEAPNAAAEPVGPPRWVAAAVIAGAVLLLFYPLHLPYQNPDQDFPVALSLYDFVRGGWSPLSLQYPSGLTNALRFAYEGALAAAHLSGSTADRFDFLVAWARDPRPFRTLARALAMLCGVGALFAVRRLGATVADGTIGLIALALLGSSFGFVREFHHGMWDAPPVAAIAGLLWACAEHSRSGSRLSIALAGAFLGAAVSFKQNDAIAGVAIVAALFAAPGPTPFAERATRAVVAGLASVAAVLVLSPAIVLEPLRFAAFLRFHLDLLYGVLPRLLEDAPPRYPLSAVLGNGYGVALIALAILGVARGLFRRERALLPVIAFAAIYAAIVARSNLVYNRYALPLAPCLAVLAAYALGAVPRAGARAAIAVLVVALQLRPTLAYLRLLAVEDTRVAAAAWLRANASPDDTMFLPGPIWAAYAAPDLPRPVQVPKAIDASLASEIQRRLPPTFPPQWRWMNALRTGPDADRNPLAPFRGAIVVTAEHPSPRFGRVVTSAGVVRALEAGAE